MIDFDALTLARLIRSKEVSPVAVVDAVLARIEALQPTVNAFITVTADEARDTARRAEAAVASGQAPRALGTDGGGSIRIPAACCGIVGLKPTLGRVPHVHQADLFASTSYIGPMARSVAEAAACFDVIAGFDPGDPYSRPESPEDPRAVIVRGLRLGWLPRVGNQLVDADVLASCEAAVRHLEGQGAHVETVAEDLAPFERTFLV